MDALKALAKQPYWVAALIVGAALIAFPMVSINKDLLFSSHPPTTWVPVIIGVPILLASAVAFMIATIPARNLAPGIPQTGIDLTVVKESNDALSTNVGNCEIRVIEGRIESFRRDSNVAIVLPCNEYFDDDCINDVRSALGAYVNREFEGQVAEFASLTQAACRQILGFGIDEQKTASVRAKSFGVGRCVLLTKPLGHNVSLALVSTTTQRAGQGLESKISYLFSGMRELSQALANSRIDEVAMPVLGAGHGGLDTPLAFVGLLIAVAEAAKYGLRGQRFRKVTIIVFRRDPESKAQVDRMIVRRALALVGSSN